MTTLSQPPVAKAEMLIRKPASEVYEAFVDPVITSKFWFTKSSGRLEAGKRAEWTWEMYGFTTGANVLELEEDRRILLEWGDESGFTMVEWTFAPRGEYETYVTIRNWGFEGDADGITAQALDSTEGFAFVLAGLKALLEHGVQLNLVADKFPDAHVGKEG